MSMRKYVKWTPKLRRWVIREMLIKKRSISDLSRSRKLSRSTIYELIKRYFKKGGLEGLEPLPRGRKTDRLSLGSEACRPSQNVARFRMTNKGLRT